MPTKSHDLPLSVAAQEQRARAWLEAGKWRQARDALKPLVKTDRGRFLPLLIEANLGLARAMLARGQTSEARQVLNYLATIAPADQMRAVELELACKTDTTTGSLTKFLDALASSSPPLSDAERTRLADRVVLAFQPVPGANPAHAPLAAEIGAIHEALLAVSQARWQAVSESLRAVPHRSVFSHWAVFIKAMAAFHTGETEKVLRLLNSLPPDSVPAQAGQAYRALVEGPAAREGSQEVSADVLDGVCRLMGAGVASGTLLRAEQLWREGRHAESYRCLREAVPRFPSRGLDWPGVLTEFYFKAPRGMLVDEWSKYLRFFDDLVYRDRLKNRSEAMLAHRLFSLMGSDNASTADLRRDWEHFLREYEAIHGKNPRLASLAYGWLGEQLSAVRGPFGFFSGPPRMRDPHGAVETLCTSIELDPANLAAHLQLCTVYRALKKTSERNRLLDKMTARFPDDKNVLVQAGQGCIDRKAFGKGLDYLARARHLDQLDPTIPELTVIALRRLARQQFEHRRPEKARETLARTESLWTEKADDLLRSRWAALVRHGVMEQLWGDEARGQALLEQSRELAPNRTAHLFFAHLAYRVYRSVGRCDSPFLAELKQALRSAPRVGGIGLLLRLLEYWRNAPETLQTHEEEALIRGALTASLGQPFTRAEAVEVIERVRDKAYFSKPVRKLVDKVLRGDPSDPRFNLWRLGFENEQAFYTGGNRARLQSILEEAMRRHDEAAIRQARQLLRDLDHPPPPNPFDLYSEAFDEDEEDDQDDEDFIDDAADELPEMPPEMLAEIGEMLEAIRNSPDSKIRKIRKKMKGEMPDFIFDALVQMAKEGGDLPPLPPAPRRDTSRPPSEPKRSTPAVPPDDANQMTFF